MGKEEFKEVYKVFFYGNTKTPTTPDGESMYFDEFIIAEEFASRMSKTCSAVDIACYTVGDEDFLTYVGGDLS